MHPGVQKGYALDFSTPTRYVATELAAAGDAGRTLAELVASYHHGMPGDLHRVRLHEHQDSDREAERWLVERVVREFGAQIALGEDGRLRLTVAPDALRDFSGKPVALIPPDPNRRFHSPFDPMTASGTFSKTIRAPAKDDTTELEESMRAFGWLDELPAIQDERGVVLVGHRRLQVAAKLGIKPNIVIHSYGDGDGGSVRRAVVAYASNAGGKPLSAADRRRFGKRMFDADDLPPGELGVQLGEAYRDARKRRVVSSPHVEPVAESESKGRNRNQPQRRMAESPTADRDIAIALALDEGVPPAQVAHQHGVEVKTLTRIRQAGTERLVERAGGLGRVRAMLVSTNGVAQEA